jgi:hypothetical protein
MTTKELKELLGDKIAEAQAAIFSSAEQLKIVYPPEISSYMPLHPAGEFLVIFNSAQYGKSKNTASIVQEKDTRFSVFAIVKHTGAGRSPEEYTDFLENALSGLRLTGNRAEKLIYPESVKFIKEMNKYWWYEMAVVCPLTSIRESH